MRSTGVSLRGSGGKFSAGQAVCGASQAPGTAGGSRICMPTTICHRKTETYRCDQLPVDSPP